MKFLGRIYNCLPHSHTFVYSHYLLTYYTDSIHFFISSTKKRITRLQNPCTFTDSLIFFLFYLMRVLGSLLTQPDLTRSLIRKEDDMIQQVLINISMGPFLSSQEPSISSVFSISSSHLIQNLNSHHIPSLPLIFIFTML